MVFGPSLAAPATIDAESARASLLTADHRRVAERIAEASITLVAGGLRPPSTRPLLIATRMERRFGPPVEEQLRLALAAVDWSDVEVLMVDPEPDREQIARAVEEGRRAEWAALLHFNRVRSFHPSAVQTGAALFELSRSIAATGVTPLVVSLGSPYVLPGFSGASALLCSYSACDVSLQAVLRVLRGELAARGTLPVAI
jgi:hypothetical protein